MTVNLMIVGVGGQGTLLASRLLGYVFEKKGYDVKISEVHGMSQRGGSVVTYVRFGEKVYSPIVSTGEADFILAFEKLEAGRYVSFLKKGGQIVTNTGRIDPMPVITGAAAYPEDVLEKLKEAGVKVDGIDANAIAREAGSEKAVNTVLLGRISKYFDIPEADWIEAIDAIVKEKFREMNKKAFRLGREA